MPATVGSCPPTALYASTELCHSQFHGFDLPSWERSSSNHKSATAAERQASWQSPTVARCAEPWASRAENNVHLVTTLDAADVEYHPPSADQALLKDVSLELPGGSLGLVYGRSGAGKTTLLQLIAGLRDPTAGNVSLVEENGLLPAHIAFPRQKPRTNGCFVFSTRGALACSFYLSGRI